MEGKGAGRGGGEREAGVGWESSEAVFVLQEETPLLPPQKEFGRDQVGVPCEGRLQSLCQKGESTFQKLSRIVHRGKSCYLGPERVG